MTEEKHENDKLIDDAETAAALELAERDAAEKQTTSEEPDSSTAKERAEALVVKPDERAEEKNAAAEEPNSDQQAEAAVPVTADTAEKEKKAFWKRQRTEKPANERKWVQIRMFPIWLRVIIIIVLMAAAALIGAYVGFSIIGDGPAGEVFKKETWQHIFDIMNGK